MYWVPQVVWVLDIEACEHYERASEPVGPINTDFMVPNGLFEADGTFRAPHGHRGSINPEPGPNGNR